MERKLVITFNDLPLGSMEVFYVPESHLGTNLPDLQDLLNIRGKYSGEDVSDKIARHVEAVQSFLNTLIGRECLVKSTDSNPEPFICIGVIDTGVCD